MSSSKRKDRSGSRANTGHHVAAHRDERGRWLKGSSSPNPTGRPAVAAQIREAAQIHGPEAIATLAKLLTNPDPMVRIHAAKALLDRGYGRPEQAVMVAALPTVAPTEPIHDAQTAAQVYEALMAGTIDIDSVRFAPSPAPALEHQAAQVIEQALPAEPIPADVMPRPEERT